jgi:hypothetical protein
MLILDSFHTAWRNREIATLEARVLNNLRKFRAAEFLELPEIGYCLRRFYIESALADVRVLHNEAREDGRL